MTDFKTLNENWNRWLLREFNASKDLSGPTKKLYRQVQLVLHPDRIGGKSPEQIRAALAKLKKLRGMPGFAGDADALQHLDKIKQGASSHLNKARKAEKKPDKKPKRDLAKREEQPKKERKPNKQPKKEKKPKEPKKDKPNRQQSKPKAPKPKPSAPSATPKALPAPKGQAPKALVNNMVKHGVKKKTAELAATQIAKRGLGAAAAAAFGGPVGMAIGAAMTAWTVYELVSWGVQAAGESARGGIAGSNPHKKGCAAQVADKTKSLSADCWPHWPKKAQCGFCKRYKRKPYIHAGKKIEAKGPSCAQVLANCGKSDEKPDKKPDKKPVSGGRGGKCASNKRYNAKLGITMKQIQTKLKEKGHSPGPIDGKCGPKTIAAIRSFQKANKLSADGIVGPKTWAKLGAGAKKAKKSDDLPGNARGAMIALPDDPKTGKKGGHERMDQFKKRFKNDPKAKQNQKKDKKKETNERLERMIKKELYNILSRLEK